MLRSALASPTLSAPIAPPLLHFQRLLRDQLGWTGYVITDEGAITFAGPGYHGYT